MRNILILDDDKSLLRLYSLGLTYAGYAATCVTTLEEAQRKLDHHHFDLFISDIRIGGISSHLMIPTLAQIQKERDLPLLVISGNVQPYLQQLDESKLNYLQKPFVNSVLVSTVEEMLEHMADLKSG